MGFKRIILSVAFLLAGVSSSFLHPVNADVLWGVGQAGTDNSSNLFRIDDYATSPNMVDLGELGAEYLDLAYDSVTGDLYGLAAGNEIRLIDPISLDTTLVADLEFGLVLNSMEFDENGVAYVYGFNPLAEGGLAFANLQSGQSGTIGPLTQFVPAGDLAFDSDGRLFLTTSDSRFVELDPTNGNATLIGPTNIASASWGMDRDSDGKFFASAFPDATSNFELYELDPTTGNAIGAGFQVANSANIGINGLTFVPTPIPEPTGLVLFSATLVAWVFRRKCRPGRKSF